MSAKKVLLSAVAAAGFAVASSAQGMYKTVNLPLGSQNFDSELLGDFVPALTNGFEYAGSDNDSAIVEPGYGNTGRALKVLSGASDSVAVPAGLYYRFTPSSTLPVSGAPVTGLSDGTGIKVAKPNGNSGFIKVEIGTKPYTE